jgi:hypothetical protein
MTPTTGATRPNRGGRHAWPGRASALHLAVVVVPTASIIVAVAWPMLFTTSGLGGDWGHHLWFVWRQSLALRADHAPSMFLNTSYSALYPQYAFYGGTIYVLAGALALALHPVTAYVVTYLCGFLAAYGGWYWAGRSLGLGRWQAQAPAVLFVTSACYLSIPYGQGDGQHRLCRGLRGARPLRAQGQISDSQAGRRGHRDRAVERAQGNMGADPARRGRPHRWCSRPHDTCGAAARPAEAIHDPAIQLSPRELRPDRCDRSL